jgi:hypothetical protein
MTRPVECPLIRRGPPCTNAEDQPVTVRRVGVPSLAIALTFIRMPGGPRQPLAAEIVNEDAQKVGSVSLVLVVPAGRTAREVAQRVGRLLNLTAVQAPSATLLTQRRSLSTPASRAHDWSAFHPPPDQFNSQPVAQRPDSPATAGTE